MLNQLLRPVVRNVARSGTRAYEVPATHRPVTMNDLPTPQGSWEARYNAKQTKYNIQLIAGVAVLTGTIAFAKVTGLIYFNASPPVPKN